MSNNIDATGAKYAIKSIEEEATVIIPLSTYNELMRVYKEYKEKEKHPTPFTPYIPDPIPPSYTRPNDYPFIPHIWC